MASKRVIAYYMNKEERSAAEKLMLNVPRLRGISGRLRVPAEGGLVYLKEIRHLANPVR